MSSESFGARFSDGALARTFLLGGRARLTLVSEVTGLRFTYRIVQRREGDPHFVQLLTGANNTTDYEFLGTIFEGNRYFHGRKSRITADAPSAKAIQYALSYLLRGQLPPSCQVWHEGRCGRCGRPLTVPSSLILGLGPECSGRGSR